MELGWFAMIPFWILVILGILALVKWMGAQQQTPTERDRSFLEVLKRRYAQGEITQHEFRVMKEDLRERG